MTFFFCCGILVVTTKQQERRQIAIIADCLLTMILLVAAFEDITDLKVRNSLIITGYLLGLICQVYSSGIICGLAYFLKGTLLPVIILYLLFLFRMLGAGDIKLISVIGGFCGTGFSLKVFAMALLVGGAFSIVRCIRYGYLWIRLTYFKEFIRDFLINKTIKPYYLRERDGDLIVIPFSPAIGVGYVIMVIMNNLYWS